VGRGEENADKNETGPILTLLLKAGDFNVVRSCQHVQFPEVHECLDRVGRVSEHDQGGGYRGSIDMGTIKANNNNDKFVIAPNHPILMFLCPIFA
jgi:hypothetical protein